MIDLIGELGIEITQWVVRECGEMHDGVEALQILPCEIAKVLTNTGNLGCRDTEIATGKQIDVQADDIVSRRLQDRSRDRTNVTLVASEKNSHSSPFLIL